MTGAKAGSISIETPLRDAVADMNRYSKTHLVITTPGIADMPVSGVFRAAPADSFARALSLAYALHAQATTTS